MHDKNTCTKLLENVSNCYNGKKSHLVKFEQNAT